jgi:hypothetical protein
MESEITIIVPHGVKKAVICVEGVRVMMVLLARAS